jgi:hypothetical protein
MGMFGLLLGQKDENVNTLISLIKEIKEALYEIVIIIKSNDDCLKGDDYTKICQQLNILVNKINTGYKLKEDIGPQADSIILKDEENIVMSTFFYEEKDLIISLGKDLKQTYKFDF